MTTIGETVRRLRDERGLSQAELADKAGVTRSWLSLLELNVTQTPSAIRLQKLAGALNVPMSMLLIGDSEPDELLAAHMAAERLLVALERHTPHSDAEADALLARGAAAIQAAAAARGIDLSPADAAQLQHASIDALVAGGATAAGLLLIQRRRAASAGADGATEPGPPAGPSPERPRSEAMLVCRS